MSANAVSFVGLFLGILAALAYARWAIWPFAVLGLLLSVAWLIADGLDGMVARATGTASALGRFLDGLCDHGVFILIYVMIAASVDTRQGWVLAVAAGAAHIVQSSLYEAQRARFHARVKGLVAPPARPGRNALVRGYDRIGASLDRFAHAFDRHLRDSANRLATGHVYGEAATPAMRLLSLLSANVRVYAIFLACLAGDPRLFWWFELVPLTLVLLGGLAWHRAIEHRIVGIARTSAHFSTPVSRNTKDAT